MMIEARLEFLAKLIEYHVAEVEKIRIEMEQLREGLKK